MAGRGAGTSSTGIRTFRYEVRRLLGIRINGARGSTGAHGKVFQVAVQWHCTALYVMKRVRQNTHQVSVCAAMALPRTTQPAGSLSSLGPTTVPTCHVLAKAQVGSWQLLEAGWWCY